MNFDFQKMKPVIQADFDSVLEKPPVDLTDLTGKIPVGGDPYDRKLAIIEAAAKECPVQIFDHYPFAFKIDLGEERHICYVGVGNRCAEKSGVDMTALDHFRELVRERNLISFGTYTDNLHRTLDHDKLLSVGFRGVYEECLERNRTETDLQKKRYREMVMRICRAVEKIGLRLRALAQEKLNLHGNDLDEDVRYNLKRIVSSVNTPWEAPVTMFDALNSILCTTWFISGLDGVEMNAYGCLDRLLLPFYERDLQTGRMTKEEAAFLICSFLHKTDMHCHFNEERKTYDNGVTVMIGGRDREEKAVYNEITDMILDAYAHNKLINPKLNARICKDSPRAYVKRLAQLLLSGNNNLVIENDEYIIPMFLKMGLTYEDACTYVGNGCQEVICPNQLHSRAFVYINTVQILLDTLRLCQNPDVMDEKDRKMYRYGRFESDTFEQLQASFLKNLRSCIQVLAEEFVPYEKKHHLINPEPMMSAFTADCIEKGMDIAEGGARYYHKTLSLVGFGTLCDSLLSLRQAYAEGSLEQLMEAVEQNFVNHAFLREKLQNSKMRFGHSEEADAFAGALAHKLADVADGICNGQDIPWHTSLFTYYMWNDMGCNTGATPDGRESGKPLSRQMNMVSPPVLTLAARSMSALAEAKFHDVGIFDLALPMIDGSQYEEAVTDYIRTCMEYKIPVLQANVTDKKMLMEEMQIKGTHPDLIVRVCGYSAVYAQLSLKMQKEIYDRI